MAGQWHYVYERLRAIIMPSVHVEKMRNLQSKEYNHETFSGLWSARDQIQMAGRPIVNVTKMYHRGFRKLAPKVCSLK